MLKTDVFNKKLKFFPTPKIRQIKTKEAIHNEINPCQVMS